MRLERFYENTEILHVNTEPDRCYYLPCDAAGNSEQILLNGVWSFQYFPSVAEAEDFLRSEFDPKKMDKIPVPSCWQFHGYDRHQYVNLFYPVRQSVRPVSQNLCGRKSEKRRARIPGF